MISDDERWYRTAVHEAGHAVTAFVVGAEIRGIVVGWFPVAGGYQRGGMTDTRHRKRHAALIAVAGYAALAEEVQGDDLAEALKFVTREQLPDVYDDARWLLDEHWESVLALGKALYEEPEFRLSGDRVVEIITAAGLTARSA